MEKRSRIEYILHVNRSDHAMVKERDQGQSMHIIHGMFTLCHSERERKRDVKQKCAHCGLFISNIVKERGQKTEYAYHS